MSRGRFTMKRYLYGRTCATVTGRVVRVRSCRSGGWRIRLSDTGGALAAARIRPSNPLPLPRVGARVLLRGALRYDEEHRWYVVDPLEGWAETPSALFSR
jgi:hypothetical protein